MFVTSAFHLSFVHNPYKPFNRSVEFQVHCVYSVSLQAVKTWMEGTNDIPYKNPYFFVTTEPNRIKAYLINNF